jgi:hypothetical protein
MLSPRAVLLAIVSLFPRLAGADEEPFYATHGKEPPAELQPFVPQGHEIFDFAMGDVDGDGRDDAILVTRRPDEEQLEDESSRPLLLLVRQPEGRLKQVRRSDQIVYCLKCGGMMGDPYQGIATARGAFTVTHYGGSAWRWSASATIAYDTAKQEWFLDKEESTSFHATEPGEMSTVVIKREELGDVPIERVGSEEKATERKQWRVVAARARFYDQPDRATSPRKAYLVKGDKVESTQVLKNFVRVYFTNGSDQSTSGFLLKRDLEPLP